MAFFSLMYRTGLLVGDVMTKKPITVLPSTTIKDCAEIMRDNHVGSLIIKIDDYLAGYLTEEDIIGKVVATSLNPSRVNASQVMSEKVVTIGPNFDIYDALLIMKKKSVRQLPVVDGERLIGLLTIKDVLRIQPQLFEMVAEKIALREEEQKMSNVSNLEGACDFCGVYSYRLSHTDEGFSCASCSSDQVKAIQNKRKY
jgi:signal-transduction protein with cAMP-binding, CBS, and nucleotidyltransferase domain